MGLPRMKLVTFVAVLALGSCDSTVVEESTSDTTNASEDRIGKRHEMVDICHRRKSDFKKIRVNSAAVDAHRRHGDGQPGDPFPKMPGYQFDSDCEPAAECPCFSVQDVISYPEEGTCYIRLSWYDPLKISLWCDFDIPPDRSFGVYPTDPGRPFYAYCWARQFFSEVATLEATESCHWNLREAGRQLGLQECFVIAVRPDGLHCYY